MLKYKEMCNDIYPKHHKYNTTVTGNVQYEVALFYIIHLSLFCLFSLDQHQLSLYHAYFYETRLSSEVDWSWLVKAQVLHSILLI